MKKWISLQAEFGNFHRRATIFVFAIKMSFSSVILSSIVIAVALPLMQFFGVLPLPLLPAIQFGVVLSWLIGGGVSGVLAMFAGVAIHELSVSRVEFERLSRTDMLSGLLNRRAFTEALECVEEDASLAIFDVDRFKAINDRYGHASGDAVIVAVSRIFASVFNGDSVVARLGGEEFGAILRGGTLSERIEHIEKARAMISREMIPVEGGDARITISAGIADIWSGRKKEAVYSAADKALYLAKALGRNRMVHESENLQHGWHPRVPESISEIQISPNAYEWQQYGHGI
jgi:diguanylate cyclase (GGDEF)-like protein